MSGDAYCTPNIRESVCQGVLVLAKGSSRSFSSCDKAQLWGWIGNDLFSTWSARLAFSRSRLGRSLDLTLFLSLQRACSRKHKGIRHQLQYQGSIACAFMGCHLLVHLLSGVTVLGQISSFALQALVCNLVAVLLAGSLPGSIVTYPTLVDCLLRSYYQDAVGDVTMGASAFSLRKNAYMQNQNLYLYLTCWMYPHL